MVKWFCSSAFVSTILQAKIATEGHWSIIQHVLLKKNYDYRNLWNLIKTAIIVVISKGGQGKTYNEHGAGKIIG